ncbi:MAG: M28 family peptidase, partial [bacterium]|nr:M28 family peptidase [bacterium]
MSDLTGNTPIKGTRLSDRYSLENKKVSRDYLYDELEALGLKPERHEYKIDGENIYAVLRSTVPSEEYIIIGAHYDSVRDCPGANDNGSGVVFVYGTAKKL